jgi:hypothetical protein
MSKHQHNSLERKYLYHITQSPIPEGPFVWQPKTNGRNRCDFEPKVPRICFSTSIAGCFVTLGDCLKFNKDISVLKTVYPVTYYTPTCKEVLDAEITEEVWRLNPVKLQCMTTISSKQICNQDIDIYDYLSFNPGIHDTLSWQKTAKNVISKIIKRFDLQEAL